MGLPIINVRHDPVAQANYGLADGQTFSPGINQVQPLGLMTFGFVVGDPYAPCGPTISTGWSACAGISTGWSLIAGVTSGWSLCI